MNLTQTSRLPVAEPFNLQNKPERPKSSSNHATFRCLLVRLGSGMTEMDSVGTGHLALPAVMK